jgi:intracellular multiplication protein IcmL
VGAMFAFTLVSLLLNGVLVYAYVYKFPKSQFLFTSDAQPVCATISLAEPNVSSAKARDFASTASLAVNTYDFYNWKQQINASLQQYFTPLGRDRYRAAMQDAGVVRSVVSKFQVTSAAVNGAPVITREGVSATGVYEWDITLPMQIYYRTKTDTLRENRIMTVSVVRVPISPLNPLGIAINRLVSTQATTQELGQ